MWPVILKKVQQFYFLLFKFHGNNKKALRGENKGNPNVNLKNFDSRQVCLLFSSTHTFFLNLRQDYFRN